MLTAAHEQTDGHYERALVIHEMDDDALNHAKEIFAEYRKRGVILNSDFGDAVWLISDQRRTVGLKLAPAPAAYHENAGTWIGCDYHCYTECIKTYIAFHLGELGADTLRELANTFTSLAEMTSDTLLDAAADNSTRHIAGLLQIVQIGRAHV